MPRRPGDLEVWDKCVFNEVWRGIEDKHKGSFASDVGKASVVIYSFAIHILHPHPKDLSTLSETALEGLSKEFDVEQRAEGRVKSLEVSRTEDHPGEHWILQLVTQVDEEAESFGRRSSHLKSAGQS